VARDEVLPVPPELERLAVVLADQVAEPRLREPHARAQLRRQVPLELLRRRVDLLERRGRFYERTCGNWLAGCTEGM
jgi:hypothetical protein